MKFKILCDWIDPHKKLLNLFCIVYNETKKRAEQTAHGQSELKKTQLRARVDPAKDKHQAVTGTNPPMKVLGQGPH